VEWQVLKESPLRNLPRPKIKKRTMNHYDENDVFEFIKALYKEHIVWRMFFITSAMSGMRRAEVIALQWLDFNFEEGYIRLTRSIPLFEDDDPYVKGTKSNEDERIIYMPDWYMGEMNGFKEFWDNEKYAAGNKWLGGDDEYVFHDGFGKPYTPNNASKMWANIIERHGLKKIRLHDLRHTMITYLLNSGESVFNVSKRAGHANSKITTDTYGHADERGGKSAIKHFEKFNPVDLVGKRSVEQTFIDSGKT
jgi:integrase